MKVTLQIRVIHETFARDYQRVMELPVVFPGLVLLNLEKRDEGSDPSEDVVRVVYYDAVSGELTAVLEHSDFREEKSGGEWLPAEVEEKYEGWELLPDARVELMKRGEADDPR